MDIHPENVSVFNAADWHEALDKFHTALIDNCKQSAVWIMDPPKYSENYFDLKTKFFEHYKRSLDKNFGWRVPNLTARSYDPILDLLSREAREGFDAMATKASRVNLIQRYHVTIDEKTHHPHFDEPSAYPKKHENLKMGDGYMKGRHIRFIFAERHLGPVLFGPSKNPLILLDEGIMKGIEKGIIANTEDLGTEWQVPNRTVVAITGQEEWGLQAIAHQSPDFIATPEDSRSQTVYNLNF